MTRDAKLVVLHEETGKMIDGLAARVAHHLYVTTETTRGPDETLKEMSAAEETMVVDHPMTAGNAERKHTGRAKGEAAREVVAPLQLTQAKSAAKKGDQINGRGPKETIALRMVPYQMIQGAGEAARTGETSVDGMHFIWTH